MSPSAELGCEVGQSVSNTKLVLLLNTHPRCWVSTAVQSQSTAVHVSPERGVVPDHTGTVGGGGGLKNGWMNCILQWGMCDRWQVRFLIRVILSTWSKYRHSQKWEGPPRSPGFSSFWPLKPDWQSSSTHTHTLISQSFYFRTNQWNAHPLQKQTNKQHRKKS